MITPITSLGSFDADAVTALISAASDVALIVDGRGVILDVLIRAEEFAREFELPSAWLGKPWVDTVSVESRRKVQAILREARTQAAPRWRHINHAAARDGQIPILYSAVWLADKERLVAFGRDLRADLELQQRLVNAQQSLEQDYSRMRHVEIRYQILFQMASEAVLIVDATTLRVAEANPAAQTLFGDRFKRVLARGLLLAFDAAGAESVQRLLTSVRGAGRADDLRVRTEDGRPVRLSASLFREDNVSRLLVRIATENASPVIAPLASKSHLLAAVESAPDGFVVLDEESRIVTANAAFLELAQLASEEQARGESLDRWLGRRGVDLDVLLVNLRQRGSVRLFATVVRGEFGATTDVEISAAASENSGQMSYSLAIRNVGRRLTVEPTTDLPPSIEHLTELIGRVSLKDLVRQSTDVIEKLCIETALKMTGDNRASAAEMLGLSRQSLYVKLRRFGLGDALQETTDPG